MFPFASKDRLTFAQAYREELLAIRPGWRSEPRLEEVSPARPHDSEPLRRLYDEVAAKDKAGDALSALCLSGGGIRSATFNLGVLQALARLDLLHRFDYLSTVSGGGYIGAWLQAWIHRTQHGERPDPPRTGEAPGADDGDRDEGAARRVLERLCRPGRAPHDGRYPGVRVPLAPEPRAIDRLREFSNYLTPRNGISSGDSWAAAAIVLRNLLLNWLVIVPVLAAALVVPQALEVVVRDGIRSSAFVPGGGPVSTRPEWAQLGSWVAIALGLLSSIATHWGRGFRATSADDGETSAAAHWRGRLFLLSSAGLLVPAATAFVLAALWSTTPFGATPSFFADAAGGSPFLQLVAWTVGLPLAGWAVGRGGRALVRRGGGAAAPAATGSPSDAPRTDGWRRAVALGVEALAIVVSGVGAAAILVWVLQGPWSLLVVRPRLFVILAVPSLLVMYVLARAIFAAIASVAEDLAPDASIGDDADREWWARMVGRVLFEAVAWIVLSAVVLVGRDTLERAWHLAVAGIGTIAAAVTAVLGRGDQTSSGRDGAPTSRRRELALKVAALVAAASLLVLLASGTAALAGTAPGAPLAAQLRGAIVVAMGLVAMSLIAGLFVNVNRFSLHRMYRNRLVRAYLGASNVDRKPDPVSGFDPADGNVPLAECRPAVDGAVRLVPILNCTLNLVSGDRLAWQERRAESFTMTPFHCGNFYEGYRATDSYGGPRGMTLGSAMAISGAAANPNMGYVSSPLITFFLALLNARLGVWLANPNENGDCVARSRGPWHATAHLVREMLGFTTRYSPYVNLSDGGHFDNLGLYEAVLRRCRLIVVSDAGCDPRCGFGDFGGAIRKIRTDFGIPIEIERELNIEVRDEHGFPQMGNHCALAHIRYSVADGDGARDGTLVYLKPTLAPHDGVPLPLDVLSYAQETPAFPHESTADQWFSEAQLESYRALGNHLVAGIAGVAPIRGFDAFFTLVRGHLGDGPALRRGVA